MIGSQTKSKEEPVRHERNPSSYQQQDSRSKGGGDTKKKVKKVICTKISDPASEQVQFNQSTMHKRSSAIRASDQLPNYMNSARSSDVRKEKSKVTHHSPTIGDRITSPRNFSNLNCSKPPTSPPDGSGLKHVKILRRKPTLKQVRPWMKKNSLGDALCPKVYANRATCSSTLKDSKFPKALELNPGGTEAEGTSVMKVCPYTYCTLSGHGHESLPPLKCFLSLRRNLLKTQKSMKVAEVSPFRKKGVGKDEKEVETGQAVLSMPPSGLETFMEEVANDFFVDIHAKQHKQIVKSVNCDERSLQEKDDTKNPEVPISLELTEDDEEGAKCKEDDGRNHMDKIHEYSSALSFEEYLYQNSDLSIEEMDVMMSVQEYVNCDQQDEDEERNSVSLVRKDDAELSLECQVMDGLVKEGEGFTGNAIKGPFEASVMNLEEDVDTFPDNNTDLSESTGDGFGPLFRHLLENDDPGNGLSLNATITSVACEIAESEVEPSHEAYEEIAEHDHTTASEGISSERNYAYSDEDKESSVINSVSCDGNVQDQSTDFLISKAIEPETLKENDLCDPPLSKENSSSVSFLGHLEASKGTEQGSELSNQAPAEAGGKQKAKISILRKRRTDEKDQMKEFNPRAPNFLPIEPDPEAEKVDLRHREMDERKNAEEWMNDYAIQQAVTKLAPAQKRKVALLVKAFETVMPMPMGEKAEQHTSQGFDHARPMQACS